MDRKVRIAVVVDDFMVQHWQCLLISKLVDNRRIQLQGIWINRKDTALSSAEKINPVFKLHLKLDKKHFNPQPDAFALKNVNEISPKLKAGPLHRGFEENELEVLDFLLWLSEDRPGQVVFSGLRKGLLQFVHGDRGESTEIFGYEDFMRRSGVVHSSLVLRNEPGQVPGNLYTTWSMMPALSLSRARNEHMWKLSSSVSRVISSFVNEEKTSLNRLAGHTTQTVPGDFSQISGLQSFVNFGKHFFRLTHKAIRKLFYREQWIFLLHNGVDPSFDFKHFKKILPPKDKFWADPFLIYRNGKHYLFFEELLYSTDKGHLCVAELDKNGLAGPVRRILEKPYHLSYPFVFEVEGTFYMIPESYENRTIQLYQCKDFPYQWEHKMNLMEDIEAFDTTVVFHNEKWWLFTTITEQKGAGHNDELYLFFADSLFTTDWKNHPCNPIISDVRRARPGGRIFVKDGKLIRPSQDCSRKYGYGFNLNEIELLSEVEYREKTVLHVTPDWGNGIRRTHSFAYEHHLTVIDGLIQRFRYF